MLLALPADPLQAIVACLTPTSRAALAGSCRALRAAVAVPRLPVGALCVMRNTERCVFAVFARVASVCASEGIVLELLDLAQDGYGAMWPQTDETAASPHRDRIRYPNAAVITTRYDAAAPFAAGWALHRSCADHGTFFANTQCRCVYDAVRLGTHVPTFVHPPAASREARAALRDVQDTQRKRTCHEARASHHPFV